MNLKSLIVLAALGYGLYFLGHRLYKGYREKVAAAAHNPSPSEAAIGYVDTLREDVNIARRQTDKYSTSVLRQAEESNKAVSSNE